MGDDGIDERYAICNIIAFVSLLNNVTDAVPGLV